MSKMNILKKMAIVAVLFVGGATAQAQMENTVSFDVSLPTGDFNDNVDLTTMVDHSLTTDNFSPMSRKYIGKDATIGIGGTYRFSYFFDVGFGEVAPYAEASLLWNQIRKTERNLYDENLQAKKPTYFNIPILLGVTYRYRLTEIISLFGEFGLGYDAFIATSEGWRDESNHPFFTYSCKGAMAWQVGVGSYFGKYVSASIHYYGLGNHIIEYANSDIQNNPNNYPAYYRDPEVLTSTVKRSVGSLMLRIGFHF